MPDKEVASTFFDLKTFFKQEIAQLSDVKRFKKTVSINGVKEDKQLTKFNLEAELVIFTNSDINRPAWSDKYRVDSIFNKKKELVQLKYSVLDEKLKTQNLTINYKNNSVASIEIVKNLDNAIATAHQTLTYTVGRGYSIQSHQSLSFSETKNIFIEVEYLLD